MEGVNVRDSMKEVVHDVKEVMIDTPIETVKEVVLEMKEAIEDKPVVFARIGTEPISTATFLNQARTMRAVGFDMDGVLFGTSTYKSVKVIGLKALLRFMFHSHSFPKREVFFESLRKLHFDTGGMSVVHQGVELPAILTAWQCGLVSGPDAEALIAKFYEEQNDWHASEVRVFRAIAHLMLDANCFVATRVILERGFSLLRHVAAWDNPPLLFGISNWDPVSFEMLRRRHPEVFDLLKIVVISGEARVCKPHISMYEHALEKLRAVVGEDLSPKEVMFLDDEQENVNGASLAGYNAHRYLDDMKTSEKPV